jgi:phosphate/sulfate permease
VVITCAVTMAAGTAAGGWRIIRTMGHKMVKMQPVHGFAAETTAATILYVTASIGVPVSTTHVISTSIMGVGAIEALRRGQVGSSRAHHLGVGAHPSHHRPAGLRFRQPAENRGKVKRLALLAR